MKSVNYDKLWILPIGVALAMIVSFCTQRESQIDSREVAVEKNKEKFTTKEAKNNALFVTDAVANGLGEIRLADIALEKSRDEELKQLALSLKNEQAILLADLTNYAAEKVITLPLTEGYEIRNKADNLRSETADFNKKWCTEMRAVHKQSIKNLEESRNKISNPVLVKWIDSALPTLRRQLDSISACHNRMN